MATLTLGLYVCTAIVGAYLFWFASDAGRDGTGARSAHLPQLALFVHPLLGLGGIVAWIAHVVTGSTALAWVAAAGLLVGGALGGFLGLRTERPRHEDAARLHAAVARGGAGPETLADLTYAEQRIPRAAVAAHGLLAAATFGTALAVALRG